MATDEPQLRIILAKLGLDGHDRGLKVVARILRDAGMDVIYTPPWQSIEAVVQLALQEDVDLIGISTLATDHLIIPDLMEALRSGGLDSVEVFVGGIVPEQERQMLTDAGVSEIFGPGSGREEIVACAIRLANRARSRKFGAQSMAS